MLVVHHDASRQEPSVAFLRKAEIVDFGFSEDVLPLRVKGGVRPGFLALEPQGRPLVASLECNAA